MLLVTRGVWALYRSILVCCMCMLIVCVTGMRVRFLGPATTTKLRDLGGILRQLTGNGASHESKLPFSERICYPPVSVVAALCIGRS